MNFSEKFTTKYSEQIEENVKLRFEFSLLQAKYENEQQIRNQFEGQLYEINQPIEMVDF